MILASDIFTNVKALLDDDDSGRYTEAKDFVPAFNDAVLYLVAIFNSAFDKKKLTPEVLRELVTTAICTTTGTTTKKIDLTAVTDIWTILGIDPSPDVAGDPSFLEETKNRWATRMTLAQWNDALADPFSAGSRVSIVSSLVRAGYIGPGAYYGNGKQYIMVRPASIFTTDVAAIWYLKNPTVAVDGTSTVEFPRVLFNLLVQKTLNYLSYQHSPQIGGYRQSIDSKYGSITEKEISQLVALMLA